MANIGKGKEKTACSEKKLSTILFHTNKEKNIITASNFTSSPSEETDGFLCLIMNEADTSVLKETPMICMILPFMQTKSISLKHYPFFLTDRIHP
jgi:hypothetical protein